MSKEITTPQLCVLIRGDVELWINKDREKELELALADKNKRFIRIDGQLVNPFEIVGVFTPEYMDERTRRKNGQWRCEQGKWHDRGQQCQCQVYTETVKAHVEGIGDIEYRR